MNQEIYVLCKKCGMIIYSDEDGIEHSFTIRPYNQGVGSHTAVFVVPSFAGFVDADTLSQV